MTGRGASLNESRWAAARKRMVGHDREGRVADDFYPTPPHGTESLLKVERFDGAIWEPACGDGAMSRVLEAAGYEVVSTDLVERGYGQAGVDFLMEWRPRAPNVVTNPPFKLAVPFVRQAMALSTGKVAMLLKIAFLEGVERATLFQETPLKHVWVFSRRLSFVSGKRQVAGNGMMAFAWFVWQHGYVGRPILGWLP